MPAQLKLRQASIHDYSDLADVMFDAVRCGPSRYTEEQRQAWVPEPRRGIEWIERLSSQKIVAATKDCKILGFMSLAENGYIDFAYVRPEAQGTGVFRQLYNEIETLAQDAKLPRLWVHASLMAEPAFSAMKFRIIKKESVTIGDHSFDRFEMEKQRGLLL